MNHEWSELFSAARDETLSREQLTRLENLLKSDPEARRTYLRFMQLQSLLESRHWEADEGALEEAITDSRIVRLSWPTAMGWLAAAAAITVLLVLGLQLLFQGQPARDSVATLLFAEDCEWHSQVAPVEGQRLPFGAIWLRHGAAVIRFDGGAELILTGDTKLRLEGATRAVLEHGEVVIRAEDGAEGFQLGTPSGDFIDLGTEFAVRTKSNGDTELHVHEGAVAVGENVVKAGQALRFDHTRKTEARPATNQAPRFAELVMRSNPRERRDLMTAYEGFFLDAGEYQPAEIIKGKGWSSPWRLRQGDEVQHGNDTSSTMRIVHGRMNMSWPVRGGRLGMLEFPPGSNIRLRQFSHPLDFSRIEITYLSFLVANEFDSSDPSGRFRVTFRSSEDYFGENLSFGWSNNNVPRISTGVGPTRRGVRNIPSNETIFCVAKITTSAGKRDSVQFRFYRETEELDIFEPADWDIELRNANLSARLDLLLLTASGKSSTYVDEIRMGPSWRSVTPLPKL